MKMPFKTTSVDGCENVMELNGIVPSEIRFDRKTRAIYIVCDDTQYTLEDLDGLSWQETKKLVLAHNGEWIDKATGIKHLIGRTK